MAGHSTDAAARNVSRAERRGLAHLPPAFALQNRPAMRTRSIVVLFALAMLVPLMARANRPPVAQPRADKGRIAVTRQQIADWINQQSPNALIKVKASDIRLRTRVDKKHGEDGHVHIQGHTPRFVSWSVKGMELKGKAYSDTILNAGKSTTVTGIKASKAPWLQTAASLTPAVEAPALETPAQAQ